MPTNDMRLLKSAAILFSLTLILSGCTSIAIGVPTPTPEAPSIVATVTEVIGSIPPPTPEAPHITKAFTNAIPPAPTAESPALIATVRSMIDESLLPTPTPSPAPTPTPTPTPTATPVPLCPPGGWESQVPFTEESVVIRTNNTKTFGYQLNVCDRLDIFIETADGLLNPVSIIDPEGGTIQTHQSTRNVNTSVEANKTGRYALSVSIPEVVNGRLNLEFVVIVGHRIVPR